MRSKRTLDLKDAKYSPELIRQYEDPDFAKASEEYQKSRMREKAGRGARAGKHDPKDIKQQPYVADSDTKKKKAEKTVNHKARVIRNIIIIIVILLILILGYAMFLLSHLDKEDTNGANFAVNKSAADEISGYRNILVLGSDARIDEGYDGSRTDAIIIVSIRKLTGEIKMISVMRDSYLKFAGADDELVLDKLTHAHAFGGGVNSCAALNRCLDLNIQEYVIFNWQAVTNLVDTLGGIDVNVKKNEIRDLNKWGPETGENVGKEYIPITKTGVQHIDGVQATTYCRIRKTSGGDAGRAERYKKVAGAVMKKMATSPAKVHALSKDVLPDIRTNMTQTQLLTAILRTPTYNMGKSIAWPKNYYGGLIGDVWYAVPRTLESEVKRLHRKAFDQKGYRVSDTVSEISDEIIYETGVQ